MNEYQCPPGIAIAGTYEPAFAAVLTPEALAFIAALVRTYAARRTELLRLRTERQQKIDAGQLPDFLPETRHIREADWTVAPIPADLQDRRVEITGPASDRKMVINALNSGAKAFMADFEDANSPTWNNTIRGQINLFDAIRRQIAFTNPDGKRYALNGQIATLIVRPRGWHLNDRHVMVDGEPVPGGILDFGLYVFHNAGELLA
ncbi:MAG: malate synthase A, partial [Bacilli bacterium]